MPEHIGKVGTKAMAWAEHIVLSPGSQGSRAEEVSRRLADRAFIFKGQVFNRRQNLGTSTKEGPGVLAHRSGHVIPQVRVSRLPQDQMANSGTGWVQAAPTRGHSSAEMVLLAPAKSVQASTNRLRPVAAQGGEQAVVEEAHGKEARSSPHIDNEEVTNKVYRLMQHDLHLERERGD